MTIYITVRTNLYIVWNVGLTGLTRVDGPRMASYFLNSNQVKYSLREGAEFNENRNNMPYNTQRNARFKYILFFPKQHRKDGHGYFHKIAEGIYYIYL